jgi:hypothetical protein
VLMPDRPDIKIVAIGVLATALLVVLIARYPAPGDGSPAPVIPTDMTSYRDCRQQGKTPTDCEKLYPTTGAEFEIP